jgi:acetyl-CoA synthetase
LKCTNFLLSVVLVIGEAIIAYATPTESNAEEEDELVKELRLLVRSEIGPFAAPDVIYITPSLPMVS